MGLQVHCFYLACLLLVASMPLSEGFFLPEKPLLLRTFEERLKDMGEKIGDTVREKLNSILEPPWMQTTTMSTTTTEELDMDTDVEAGIGEERQIIVAPIRCPPNHDFARGRCRRKLR
ncbi:secapin-like [Osmia lignaria lignaria]|uniref:secapin-like n=1 Tax=Osmia lignaria lignaria TaxID=1437193 RepID=UPI0014780F9D|nr:uncharacterized protein LOC117604815 [Osmia lignaria]